MPSPSDALPFYMQKAQHMGCAELEPSDILGVCRVVGTILTWLVSPFVLGGVAVILAFLLLVTQGQRSHFRKDREKLRNEFEQYRKQMQAKVRSIILLFIYSCIWKGKLWAIQVERSPLIFASMACKGLAANLHGCWCIFAC